MEARLVRSLWSGIYPGDYDAILEALLMGADPNSRGWSDLVPIIESLGDLYIVILLLDHGADPNAVGPDGMTALCESITINGIDNEAHVGILLNYGADPNLCGSNRTPLIYAVTCEMPDIVRLLLEHGADPNIACGRLSALIGALVLRSDVMVQMLLEYGARVCKRLISILSQDMRDYAYELEQTRWTYLTKLMARCGAFEEGLIYLILSY